MIRLRILRLFAALAVLALTAFASAGAVASTSAPNLCQRERNRQLPGAGGLGEIDPGFENKEVLLATSQDGNPLDSAGPRLVVPGDISGRRYVSNVNRVFLEKPPALIRACPVDLLAWIR